MDRDRSSEPIAIIGMECVFPGARDLAGFWSNIVRGVDSITELPPSRWDPSSFDLPPLMAGCIDGLTDFDPLELGVVPSALEEGDPEQFLVLGVIHRALSDAFPHRQEVTSGPRPAKLPPEIGRRTELVIGRGGYMGHGIEHLHLQMEVVDQIARLVSSSGPGLDGDALSELRRALAEAVPPLTAESVTAALPNLGAGRAVNRLDVMGASFTVDAACASALVAVDTVVRSLRGGRCELGVAAAVHLNQKPSIWRAFETLGVLSPEGRMRPFDVACSGLVMGEGIGALVLKRLEDAERDRDRVYAVIRGLGVASDGRGTGLLTPNLDGEVLALRRAYEDAGVDPESVSLIEGHGTATSVGDRTEIAALREALGDREWPTVALGSVKSMIGHAMPAAGMAGLIKAALALYHRTLPPTLNVDRQHPDLEGSALFVNTRTAPWISPHGAPRRAGVNAFGFGGINAHAVLEEAFRGDDWLSLTPRSFELVLLSADTRDRLGEKILEWRDRLDAGHDLELRDVAFTTAQRFSASAEFRLAVVAAELPDLATMLHRAQRRITTADEKTWVEDDGVYFGSVPAEGKTAVVFPGIGFPGLAGGFTRRLGELCLHFPEAHDLLDLADSLLIEDDLPYPLHSQFFPPPLLDPESQTRIEHELGWSSRTPTAFIMANLAGWAVIDRLGLDPDGLVGFSLGEMVALIAAGAFDTSIVDRGFLRQLKRLERSLDIPEDDTLWAMVAAPNETVETVLERFEGRVSLAMDVAPGQTFIAGDAVAVRGALNVLGESGIWSQELPQLPMLQPFLVVHTPTAKRIADRYKALLAKTLVFPPGRPVYSGSTGSRYTSNPRRLRTELLDSMTGTVRIRDVIESMYEEGFRVFVQLGAGGKLLANIHNTLGPRPHAAIALDLEARGGLEQLLHACARLASLGVSFDPVELFHHRRCVEIAFEEGTAKPRGVRELSLEPPRLDTQRAAAAIRDYVGTQASSPASGTLDETAPVSGAAHEGPTELPAIFDRLLALLAEHDRAEQRVLEGVVDLQGRMAALLQRDDLGPGAAEISGDSVPSSWPMLDTVHRLEPGQGLAATLELDLDRHRFLNDHTFVNLPDGLKAPERRLPTLPLTFGLEVIAEAAKTVAPQLRIIEIRDVEARTWISLEDSRTLVVRVNARTTAPGVIRVELRPEGEDRPSLVGYAVLGERYAEQRAPIDAQLDRPSPYTAQQFYAAGPLFHGATFKVIRELHQVGDSAASAEVVVSDPQEWFAHPLLEGPILEPVLLDGLAQVAGYRAWMDGVLVLPVSLDRFRLYAPLPPPGSTIRTVVRLTHDDGRLVNIDIDALSGSGELLLSFEGLRSWRVFCPASLLELNHRPRDLRIASRRNLPDGSHCHEVVRDDLGDLGPDWVARLYLGDGEWAGYHEHRRLDWLLGRIAAKDALRFDLRRDGRTLHPVELVLDNSGAGAPVVIEPESEAAPTFSIAHLEDHAVAVTGGPGGVGIDLVAIEERSDDFVATAFDAAERMLIENAVGGAALELHRAWAAKEAAAKAHGWGLEGMTRLKVTALRDNEVELANGDQSMTVVTSVDRNRVVAVARLPR
jgi:acyl transferase domain-containing protein/phosphopantetheinyl transferase (holo-ACP synthase)